MTLYLDFGNPLYNTFFLFTKNRAVWCGFLLLKTMDYKTKRWLAKRKRILKRDKYLCQYYLRYGKRVDANTVHHIYPADDFPQYRFCDWNLISLSQKAHDKMHNRTDGSLSAEGLRLMERTPPPLDGSK